ncbi:MAG TPA: hypothetical protein GX723_06980 [Thermoanaerobacterales bacterium]|jgi:hypothetical protein|nr:hypothetical protein [Thermoanaerobacterales bacterium]
MQVFLFIVVAVVAFVVGIFGFAQIIGSLRTKQKNFLLPIIIWLAILVGEFFLARLIVSDYMNAFYIGTGISLIIILLQKKIE